MKHSEGFTLIELLIAISIVGILIIALLPSILGAQRRAFDAAAMGCANEIKIKQGTYLIDHHTYATEAQLVGEYAIGCVGGIIISETSQPNATHYTLTTRHIDGTKTYTISNEGLEKN